MEFSSTIDHESRTEVDVEKTTYKWYLPFWSLLSEYYSEGVESSEFDVMEGENYKCKLKFYLSQLNIEFTGTRPQLRSFRVTLSFVDESMKKLFTVPSGNIMSGSEFPTLRYYSTINPSPYLQNDTLIIYFELWIVKAVYKIPSLTSNTVNWRQLNRTNYEQRYNDKLFCDVTFVVEGVKLKAHKLILSENSDVFKAMFTTGMQEEKESSVKIEGIDRKIFEIFLRFMYTGKIQDIDNIATELLIVANRYQVMDLITLCENNMKRQLSADNATAYLLIAHRIGCMSLEDGAVEFLKRNTQILADPDEYKLLSDCPALLKRIFGKADRE